MSLRLQSQLFVDNVPDEALDNAFEVIMPTLRIGTPTKTLLSQYFSTKFLSEMVSKDYTPIVEEIRFGTRTFGNDTRRIRTGWLNVPKDIENLSEVKITMFCSEAMLTQYYIEAWKALVFNEDGEYYNHMDYYKRNIEIYFFGTGNVGAIVPPSAHYTLVGCYPTTQQEYNLKYTMKPKRLTITQNFRVDKIRFDEELMKSSIKEELIGSPLGLTDKFLSAVSNDTSKYYLNNTY